MSPSRIAHEAVFIAVRSQGPGRTTHTFSGEVPHVSTGEHIRRVLTQTIPGTDAERRWHETRRKRWPNWRTTFSAPQPPCDAP